MGRIKFRKATKADIMRYTLTRQEILIKEQANEILKEISVLLNATHRFEPGAKKALVDIKAPRNLLIRIRNNAKRIIRASRAAQKFL